MLNIPSLVIFVNERNGRRVHTENDMRQAPIIQSTGDDGIVDDPRPGPLPVPCTVAAPPTPACRGRPPAR